MGPKMLVGLLGGHDTIPTSACAFQMFFFASASDCEYCLLAAMAYDCYAALCCPLHYGVCMALRLRQILAAVSNIAGAASGTIRTRIEFHLSFCSTRTLDHFFCDIPPGLGLACAITDLNQILLLAVCGAIQSITLAAVMASYGMMHYSMGHNRSW
ncbi:hypothetical protein JRQ81_003712 [Phrynocephalus forsythii]|uniref:Uncharacterized protein n=1 Tax=Phrynocephalus forsythii TaxID=171643 RepID=A0A9Q1AXQ1_9SAUR|nr:hypothetical protein JRQ81_003712 [Phrynocephalus forsythii]